MGEKRKDAGVALDASASWEALCVRAAGLTHVEGTPLSVRLTTEEALGFAVWSAARTEEVWDEELAGLALFARLMAVVARAT